MIKRCIDISVIKSILTHKDVLDWVTDDNSPIPYDPVIHPSIIYLVDEKEQGVIRIDPFNGIACTVHIATLPDMWGNAHEFCKEAIEWGFTFTKYLKVIAFIPGYNKNAIKLVTDIGFKKEGVLTKSFLKNWKLHDQIIFGFCKGELKCQW